MNEPFVALRQVSLVLSSRAGAVEILREIDLSLACGEAVALVGPSGSGKTSLLMVLAGLERATAGEVIVDGERLSRLSEDERALLRGQKIGVVFQSFHLVPTMTALENVALPLEFRGDGDAAGRARLLLEEVGLWPRRDHFPAQLSGGEQQRVAIARALAPKPRLLLADEPTGNLDQRTGRHVIDLLFRLCRREGATLVLVTHDERIAADCDRVVRMADGRITDSGSLPLRHGAAAE